jgi:SPP1 gp7 family putative phage head morphogenesis protein
MLPDPLVVQIMRAHKADILAQEEDIMRNLSSRWVRMENSLEAQMTALAAEIQESLKSGQVPSAALIRQHERYARFVYQAHGEMKNFIEYAGENISKYQEISIELGITNASDAIRAVYQQAGMIGSYFDILPKGALETLIGLAGDGTPLSQYLRRIYGDATDGLLQALIDGLAQGMNPAKIAEMMRDGFGMGLNHALNTARTESLRAYSHASLEQYRNSGVVNGWKRLARHDGNTCAGCLFSEGERFDNEAEFEEHNQGRCMAVPCVEGIDDPIWTSGKDWFEAQDEETQRSILGQGRYDAWQNGASLDDMVTRVSDPVWGGAFVPTPVEQLVNIGQ